MPPSKKQQRGAQKSPPRKACNLREFDAIVREMPYWAVLILQVLTIITILWIGYWAINWCFEYIFPKEKEKEVAPPSLWEMFHFK